ncbi:hypothetical protein G7Y89_g10890 [Cudoniella acicularis]|uniref:Uncharacterized protein n=1 Tax=Cudoniella acicularis TaxID=354080 RepID=A0A8H4RE79_9HELO|nr:hypothetical protein G7Y89_g10890 [Cudoniella acicularis]
MDNTALPVVCAWPVSGQYGPGSRALYYVLIAGCIFARKEEWLRNACLAAALLFPAVAAIHGIVLAAIHVNGAVDMDIYGAFQLCSIGILTAPIIVKLSRTYFYDLCRSSIFLWTGLMLAGLLSLTVEFFRIETSDCTQDESGNPISSQPRFFPYNTTTCGLTCSVDRGPFSPMRAGSANNIYVIPAPDKFTFDTAMLLAVACCIPALLSTISMWNKTLDINRKSRFGNRSEEQKPIEGTNGITTEKSGTFRPSLIRIFFNAVEIPMFGSIVLVILILGERNFFSPQVRYETEPITSIGQWAPVLGSGLAALGSLYLLLAVAADIEALKEEEKSNIAAHHHNFNYSTPDVLTPGTTVLFPSSSDSGKGNLEEKEIVPIVSKHGSSQRHQVTRSCPRSRVVSGNRRKLAKALITLGRYFSTVRDGWYHNSNSKTSSASSRLGVDGSSRMTRAGPSRRPPPTTFRAERTSPLQTLTETKKEAVEKVIKTRQEQKPARPGIIRQFVDQIVALRRRPPEAGKIRIGWQCWLGNEQHNKLEIIFEQYWTTTI